MQREKQCGFTLYEVLITLLVVGIVLALGLPNLSDFTRNSRVTGTANDLHGSIMLGRSEAARSKENITICASDDPMGAAACDGASFEDGWILFVDLNGDIARDAGESVLKAFPPVHEDLDVLTPNGATYFAFAPTGLGRGDVAGPSLTRAFLCDDRGNIVAAGGNSAARALVVTPVGRSIVIRDQVLIAAMPGVPC